MFAGLPKGWKASSQQTQRQCWFSQNKGKRKTHPSAERLPCSRGGSAPPLPNKDSSQADGGGYLGLPAIPASHRPGPEATAGEAPVLGSVSLLQSLHTARGLKVAGNQVPSRKEALAALPTAAPRHSDSEGLRLSQGHAHWPVPTQQSNLRKAAGRGSLSARRKPDLGAPSTCHQHPLCQTRRPPAAPAPTLVSWQSRSECTQAVRGARGGRMG